MGALLRLSETRIHLNHAVFYISCDRHSAAIFGSLQELQAFKIEDTLGKLPFLYIHRFASLSISPCKVLDRAVNGWMAIQPDANAAIAPAGQSLRAMQRFDPLEIEEVRQWGDALVEDQARF